MVGAHQHRMVYMCVGIMVVTGIVSVVSAEEYVTRKEIQLRIRESISEEEFKRMLELRKQTGKSWSDIFDYTIEPEREEKMRQDNRSLRRYILSQDEQRRKPGDQAIRVNSALPEDDEKPLSVKEAPQTQRRQRMYTKEGRRPVVEDLDKESVRSSGGLPPETSMRRRLKAIREMEESGGKIGKDKVARQSRLYKSSGRQSRKKDVEDLEEQVQQEVEEEENKGFGASVLGKRENRIFGNREDRFEGFGSKKDHERKLFRSGTISNNDRKTSMFGDDEEE